MSKQPYSITPQAVRRVWAQLTKTPTATVTELMRSTGFSRQTVQQSINRLDFLGYVERDPGVARGRRVIVPFVEVQAASWSTRPPFWERPTPVRVA